MNIPTLIVEDNPQAAAALAEMLEKQKQLAPVQVAHSLAEARDAICTLRPVLLFLDIELPDGNGIDFWEEMRNTYAGFLHVVFYTAFDQYVLRVLRAGGHDYLLKPVSQEEVVAALSRFYTSCTEHYLSVQNAGGGSAARGEQPQDILVLDNLGNRVAIKPAEICFFRYVSPRKLWEVFCMDGSSYTLRHGAKAPLLLQISPNFVQTHKSYIVNTSCITRIEGSHIFLTHPYENFDEVQVSKLYRNELLERFCLL